MRPKRTRTGKKCTHVVDGVLCQNKDDGAVFVNQSQRPVLQLSRENSLAVEISKFLDFLLTKRKERRRKRTEKEKKKKKEE